MSLSLTSAELTHYRSHGYVVRQQVFDAAEVACLCDAAEATAAHYHQQTDQGQTYQLDGKRFTDVGTTTVQFEHQPDTTQLRVIEPAHLAHPAIDALIDDPRVVSPMQQILGSEHLSVWTSKLNLKRPGEGSGFGWHQDSPYWIHDCRWVDQLPNVMLALDAQTKGNGCFRVIRGSHQRGILPGTNDGTQLGGFFTDPACYRLEDQVLFEVAAGSLIFFDPHIIHGSDRNPSKEHRRALILTYQPGHHPMLKNGALRIVKQS